MNACLTTNLQCNIQAMPYGDMLELLRGGEISGIVSGPQLTDALAKEFQITRPYFRSLGRFVVRAGSAIKSPDTRSLAGLRVGMVANTSHARFLEQFYGRSALTAYDTPQAMLEALRTGQLDAAFADSLALAFWLDGQSSRKCCSYLGNAFVHLATFSRSLAFVAAKSDSDLRQRLDAGLDQMEVKGVTAGIIARYLPYSVW